MTEIFNTTFWIQLITSFLGSAAFAVLFHVRPKLTPYAILGGGITYAAYYVVETVSLSVFAAGFAAGAVSALYAESMARGVRAPALVFLVPSAIPVVPGGSLYRTMIHLISQQFDEAMHYLMITLKVGIGIAGGIVAISLFFSMAVELRVRLRRKRKNRQNDTTKKEM